MMVSYGFIIQACYTQMNLSTCQNLEAMFALKMAYVVCG